MNIDKNVTVSDSGFVFNSTTGESFSVNPIGIEIIDLLNKNNTLSEISLYLNSKYNADILTIENEVTAFIHSLMQNSLIDNQNTA